ncbi:non-ribosomal peptide synthase/polyketide synthase [Azotobacter vinelandii DJ]|uniref:non-ribosomal peptide synthase/polyketide synthase n=1 Tax=Azotobacter vinelandii TaxID=354 RepID=UPI0030D29767
MNAEDAQKLARRFIELPQEKRRLFLQGLWEEGVDFSLFPIPADVGIPERQGLSYAQQRMWFLWQLDPQSPAYNLPMAVRLEGELERVALQDAFDALVTRHETLRTRFRQQDGGIRQEVLEPLSVTIGFEDLTALLPAKQDEQVSKLAQVEAMAPFDLAEAPLLRVRLLKLSDSEHVLLLTLHHIVADGWSLNLLIDEFIHLYDTACSGRQAELPALPIQYRDYALWQRSWLEAGERERQLIYWRDKLGGEHTSLELPTDRPRPAVPSYRGTRHEFRIEPLLSDQLRALAKRHNVTLFIVLLAAFKLLMQRYSGQSVIRIGSPIANRHRSEVEGLIGCFINTQVLHTEIDPLIDVGELLRRVKETVLGAQVHQDLPFEQLVEVLNLERDTGQSPLFQVLFNHQPNVTDVRELKTRSGLTLERIEPARHTARFDLALDTYESAGQLYAAFTYALEVFDGTTVAKLEEHWLRLLEGIAEEEPTVVGELSLSQVTDAADERVDHSLEESDCVHQLIERAASQHPERLAAVSGNDVINYARLNERADELARVLFDAGVLPDQRVGVVGDRSIDMLVGILGILKAGAAYLPLEPDQPQERLAFMLADSDVRLVLGRSSWEGLLPDGVRMICLDEPLPPVSGSAGLHVRVSPGNLAYVIYTSGTTGMPKGVAVPHGALANYVEGISRRLPLEAISSMAMVSTPAADLGHTVLFGALCAGKTLHLLDKETVLDAEAFAAHMDAHGVDALKIVPSHLDAMLSAGRSALPRRCLVLGGEACPPALLARIVALAPELKVLNHYGPTETTVGVLIGELKGLPVLGSPLENVGVRRLDACLQPAPGPAKGELHISGAGLARGYLGRPALTAERFVPDPSGTPGGRMYRTGDWVRRNADGGLLFAGRMDGQVKIRGYRVELAEIESRLRALPGVGNALLRVIGEEHARQLVAYLVPTAVPDGQAGQAFLDEIRTVLKRVLPEHMVPTHLLVLEHLPVTANGKVDLKALPEPVATSATYVAPGTPLQTRLAEIWAKVLKAEQVGLTDNFFELGGHSLLATQVISRVRQSLGIELPLRALFEAQDLAGFVGRVGLGQVSQAPALEKADRDQPLVASYAQQRQWFLWQLEPGSAAYHIPAALRLKGALDIEALRRSFDALIRRHESLRTTFRQDGERTLQVIHPSGSLWFEQEPLPADAAIGLDERIRVQVEAEVQRLFDLEQGPLLRVKLLRLDEDDHVLILSLHHIVSDGWSTPIMVDELVRLYEGYSQGHEVTLPELPVQYADYALWQRQWMEAGERDRQLAYWTAQLGGEQPVLELPGDRPRPAVQSHAGARLAVELDGELARSLRELARREGVTLFMLLLASFQSLLHRYSGQDDIRVGVPIANRTRAETEGLIGFFVNTQVLKAEFELQTTFVELLRQVKRTALEAQAHQDLPFEQLVEALQPERSLSHSPLFQVMYNHQTAVKGAARSLPGLSVEGLAWENRTTQFDLTLDSYEGPDSLGASLTYATDLFDASTVKRLAGHWRNLLASIVRQPERRIGELPLLTPEEYRQIVHAWNRTEARYPSERGVHQLIEEQVARTPEVVALVFGEQEMSYRELNRRANRLAHRLIELGVGPDVLVGVAVERGFEMVVGLLAILKAGGAYVPLDPEYPRERLAYMIEDSGIGLLLTQRHLQDRLPSADGVQSLFLEPGDDWLENYPPENPANRTAPQNLAYVIYTSGSTGRPKGAGNTHTALINRLHWMQKAYQLDTTDTVLQKTPFSFDVSVWELFWPLLNGARLAIARPGEHRDPERLIDTIERHGVTTLHFVPSMLQAFISVEHIEGCRSIRRLVCSGEALPAELARKTLERMPAVGLFNLYGPTEAAIDVTHWTCDHVDPEGVPIGQPIDNLKTHILEESLHPVAPRCCGELYLGGVGLARGYHNRPGLTAERFIPDPFDTSEQGGGRLYRTGDLARYRAGGVIEYLGRIDHQVKIRGFRIELGEIEARLRQHGAVREAVVIDVEGAGGRQLAAYLVPDDPAMLDGDERQGALRGELKDHLRAALPDYMVPAHLVFLARLPLTPNGKLDRKALPRPNASLLQRAYVAPASELEQRIAAIWAEVLKVERVGLTDNFFELGGDSIVSIQVVSRARQAGIAFTPKELFQHQTVQGLTTVAQRTGGLCIDQGAVTGTMPLTSIQRMFFEEEIPERHHWNQSVLLEPNERLVVEPLEAALQRVVEHHDALRLRFIQQEGRWSAGFRDREEAELLWQSQVSDIGELEAVCNEAQASLDLEHGPLLRAVLASLPDGRQRLLLVIHHLVVDGISWRVLLEDLQTAYRQAVQSQPLHLPAKSSSFKAWSERLEQYAAEATLAEELGYWQRQLQEATDELPCDHPQGGHQRKQAAFATTHLDRDWTRRLLQEAPAAYRTQVNDLLLAALARVICRWSGQASTLVRLEGHGREDLFDDLDITRTVGWFTSLFPVKLTPRSEIADSIKTVKEQLRAVPNKGIGYGLLRYLGSETARQTLQRLPRGEIVFNYLGQFDQSFEAEAALFAPAGESSGQGRSEAAPLDALLSLDGQVYGGELRLTWTFSRERFAEATIQRLADAYARELEALVGHCADENNRGMTPSDVPLAGLSQEQLDALPVPAGEIEDIYPLSPMQQGMLFHSLLEGEAGHYINQMRVDVEGLDVARFRAAWQAVVDRHEVLRASFVEVDGRPLQVIRRQVSMPCVELDWRSQPQLQDSLDTWAQTDRQRGFDLEREPLLRLAVIRTGENRHHLIYTNHHILLDGWSGSQLQGEVLQAYTGKPIGHPGLRYRDYIAWLGRQDRAASEAFWREQLGALEEPTRLAQAIKIDEAEKRAGHGDHQQVFDPQQTRCLSEFARAQRVTVNTLVQAAWLLLLQRYSGQATVCFGATVAGRPAELQGVEGQLGLFINTLPVIASPRAEQRVGEWLGQVQAQNLGLREHEHTPLYEIQRWAGLGGEALFDSLLVFENYPIAEALQQGAPEGLVFERLAVREQTNYPLTLAIGLGETLTVRYGYDRGHFDAAGIERIAGHFARLLQGLTSDARAAIGELPLLAPEEYRQIVHDWNRTEASYPSERSVHQLIEDQVARTPEAVALVFGEQEMSYGELNRRANRLAHRLIELGVGPDVLVGIAVERGVEMVVGLLAILKAGGAYVPLDPEYPRERLAYMIGDSGVGLLLTHASLLEHLPREHHDKALLLDRLSLEGYPPENPVNRTMPQNLAYVIYTSGSTGQPKGAAVRIGSFVNLLHWYRAACELTADDRVLLLSSYSFDLTQKNLYGVLCAGGQLHIAPAGYDPDSHRRQIGKHRLSVLNCAPSAFYPLLQGDRAELASLKHVLLGGEAIQPGELAEWLESPQAANVSIHNTYGPTECTDVVIARATPGSAVPGLSALPIGRPLPGVSAYVLDGSAGPVALGQAGELHIGGDCVGEGYWHRPSLTAERFVPDPFDDSAQGGGRLYRTGDLARYRADGVIEYLGRIDHQVKIRGFRIELGEIEARLQQHGAVREAVVIDIDGAGGKQLAAYLVPNDLAILDGDERQGALRIELKDHLRTTLPDYMVPAHLVFLARLPLTPNGKLDRKALPRPDASLLQRAYVAPASELEQRIAAIWAEVLKVERVGLTDNFFELGGHSLLATQVISRVRQSLGIELPLRALFEAQDLAGFAGRVGLGQVSQAPALEKADRDQPLVASYAQQRQWFLWQLEPGSAAYHIPAALRLKGALDIEALRRSFEALIRRHESLRTIFRQDGERTIQVIPPSGSLWFEQEPLPADAAIGLDERIRVQVEAEVQRLFDLEQGPLLRVKLLRLDEDDHVLVLTLHHIVSDGWSTPLMVDELVRLYEGYSQGHEVRLPELPVQYADYALWQRQWMEAGERDRQLAYWTAQLGGEQPVLELPGDRPRPAVQTYAGARLAVELDGELARSLRELARREGVTLFMLLLASFQSLLHRYSGQDDIRVGVPIANRTRAETEGLIGFFVNTQVLKAEFGLQTTFVELLRQVKRTALEAQAHQDLPFEQLVEALQPERSLSHSPLFQVMYNHQTAVKGEARTLPGLRVEGLAWENRTTQFDLTLDSYESADSLGASLTYATDLFDERTIERLARHWLNLLAGIVRQPERRISELALLDPEEYRRIVHAWNQTEARYPSERGVHQLIEEQVARTPEAVALVFGDEALTYGELNRRANRLAHRLIELGVGPDVLVGIAVERGFEMVVGLLAILKAGGAYVPLDPEYPRERLAYMIEDSGIDLLLTQEHLADQLPAASVNIWRLDSDWSELNGFPASNPDLPLHPEHLAYCIYTSGSTGRPKGVAVRHQALTNFMASMASQPGLDANDRMLVLTSLSFDIAALELYLPLLVGGTVVLLFNHQNRDAQALLEVIDRQSVSVVQATPSTWRMLLDTASPGALRDCKLLSGGEALSPDLTERLLRQAGHVWNLYGPTETTIWSGLYHIDAEHPSPWLGRPIANTTLHILEKSFAPVPERVAGELLIGGDGLARGYLHRPDLTAERFIPDPFDDSEQGGGRLYRTGDLARYRADGVIEYLGRIDHQVKIRGFRIELGEIEARLQQHGAVHEAVVIDIDGAGGRQLAAYLVPDDLAMLDGDERQTGLRRELKAHLGAALPDYMVPAHLVFLERLPLTPNGKLDRKALPRPDASLLQQQYVEPQTELEQRIAAIWAEVLKVERVGLTDNFFELGGHSLLATQAISSINVQLGIDLPLRLIFEKPILNEFSMTLENHGLSLSEADLSDIEKLMNEMAEV